MSDSLREFGPFVQFKKREKNSWRTDTFNFFNVFQTVQVAQNRAEHHVLIICFLTLQTHYLV